MFGFVGQSSKMDNKDVYDSYINVVPPLKRSSEVLVKTLEFFGWSHVAMIGGGLDSNTWDKVDALWKTIENPLRDNFKLAAALKFDTSDPQLVYRNVKFIATVARGERERCFWLSKTTHNHMLTCDLATKCVRLTLRPPSDCGADKLHGLHGSVAGG